MSDTQPTIALSAAEARRIDLICDRFEAAWKLGPPPRLEEYLGGAEETERSALLRHLLLLDWDYGRSSGGHPHASDYHTRFPGDRALIEDVGREMKELAEQPCAESDPPHARDTPGYDADRPARIDNSSRLEVGSDRYELLHEVGHGGIGVVFRGHDRRLGRDLAVKVLRESYRDKPEAQRRFVEEARVGSRLQHPAIVPVYELGSFGDRRPFFTMKLVEGRTLAAMLHDRADPRLDLPRYLGIFEQVCQAMAYAHARGVVHRDLKPANVMVGAFGEVQVMDWGFAKVICGPEGKNECGNETADSTFQEPRAEAGPATQSGSLMGTPAYMPPEQARGETALIDPRADVFALGAILCEILTSRPPYVGETADQVCRKAADGDLGDAHARIDACAADEALRALAKQCLGAERAVRPADARVVAGDLTAYLASAREQVRLAQLQRAAAEARADEAGAKAKAERHARKLTLALAAAAAVLLALAATGWWWNERVQRRHAIRVASTNSKVEAAFAEATDHLDRNDWSRAKAAATRARELLESGANDNWKPQVDEMLANLETLGKLEDIGLLRVAYDGADQNFLREVMTRYADAFARCGIRPGMNPVELAALIGQHPVPIRAALVIGLENWWLIARSHDGVANDWFAAALSAADADAWRNRVRQAVFKRDRRLLESLAVNPELARQPQSAVNLLIWALLDDKAYDAAIALLRPAQQRFPNDFWINFSLGRALRVRQPPNYSEALRFYSIARALRPEALVYVNLAGLLIKQNDWDGAIAASRQALEQRADDAEAYNNLGVGLEHKGEWEQAQSAYRKAVELKPGLAEVHYNLGMSLQRRGQFDRAIAAYERAIQLSPGDSEVHFALGNALNLRKDVDAALSAFAKTIELNPGFALAHNNRGNALLSKGRVDEAIAAYDCAIRLNPAMDLAHSNLGNAWRRKGQVQRAIAAHSRAIELNGKSAANYYNLGAVLRETSDWAGAVAAYRNAVRLAPNLAEAHCNLGLTLQEQGLFAEALEEIERGDQLGTRGPNWSYPSDQWVKRAQRFAQLEANLAGVVNGNAKLSTAADQLEYAEVCRLKGLFAASASLYLQAFAAEPPLVKEADAEHRYRAACVAALAAGSSALDEPVRARWRKQAHEWLLADLALWADRLEESPDVRSPAHTMLQRWLNEKALAGIRDPQELAKLPEIERAACLRLWADVQHLLVRSLASSSGK